MNLLKLNEPRCFSSTKKKKQNHKMWSLLFKTIFHILIFLAYALLYCLMKLISSFSVAIQVDFLVRFWLLWKKKSAAFHALGFKIWMLNHSNLS